MQPAVFPHPDFSAHALLDSGDGEKLERFGEVVLARPDPQAIWRPRLPREEWRRRADLVFVRESDRGGRWEPRRGCHRAARGAGNRRASWTVRYREARLVVRPTPFKHVGVFPEQAANWEWVRRAGEVLAGAPGACGAAERPRLLNLFGYTGAASVLAAQAGFRVTHVDASRTSIAWARENAEASGLADDALRILLDDALSFTRREVRRGARYEGILIDPPHYGRGPKGERWRFETDVAPLLEACGRLLAERAFLVLTTYAIGYLPLACANLLAELERGRVDAGELALPEEELPGGATPRALSCGVCARWRRELELGSP